MKPGENGIYLSINADGKEVTEKISVNISYVKKGMREKRFGDFAKEDIKTQLERLKKELERTKAVKE